MSVNNPLNISEAHAIIVALKSLDLKSVTKDEVLYHIKKLSQHAGIVTKLPAGTVICRSVSCNYLRGEYPINISQISYNPNLENCSYSRASWEGTSAFYGCLESEYLEAYNTTFFELLEDLRENPAEIAQELFVTGKWILQQDLDILTLSGDFNIATGANKARNEKLIEFVSANLDNKATLELIDDYLSWEFSKKVLNDEKWKYKISAAYSEYIHDDNWPGLIYPSYQTNGAGINIILHSDVVDKGIIKLERAAGVIQYKRGMRHMNEFVMEAIPDELSLRWKELYNYKLPPGMRAFITGKSDYDPMENTHYLDLS